MSEDRRLRMASRFRKITTGFPKILPQMSASIMVHLRINKCFAAVQDVHTATANRLIALYASTVAKRSALGTASPGVILTITLDQPAGHLVCDQLGYAAPNELPGALHAPQYFCLRPMAVMISCVVWSQVLSING